MRGNASWSGGAALVVGILLGALADRLARSSGRSAAVVAPPAEARKQGPQEPVPIADDLLERYRAAAAV